MRPWSGTKISRRAWVAELARAIRLADSALKIDPLHFPVLYTSVSGRRVHRVVLRRFPYSLHYLIDRELVTVITCMHARRDPMVFPRSLSVVDETRIRAQALFFRQRADQR